MKILSLGTFPIRRPVHGGQRRIAALGAAHQRAGHHVLYASGYDPNGYATEAATRFDFPIHEPDFLGGGWAGDIHAGIYCSENAEAFGHFLELDRAVVPDVYLLEQPFMWPVVVKLLELRPDARVVYSSHNVEAPLKEEVLLAGGLGTTLAQRIGKQTERLELDLTSRADAIICVSEKDAGWYRARRTAARVVVVPNGVDTEKPQGNDSFSDIFPGRYLLFVGSMHLPNMTGFMNLVVGNGLQFLPPNKHLAVVGGVSELIYNNPRFQERLVSNCDRVHFFAKASDEQLSSLIDSAHGIILPVQTGGGTNLKTAEALWSGKWVLGTTSAFRGFEDRKKEPGVIIADDHAAFVSSMRAILAESPFEFDEKLRLRRIGLTWESITEMLDVEKLLADS